MSDPPLPPPPSSMAPPPGYAAYQASNWQSQLRRIGGLAKAILILLAVAAVGQVLALATTGAARDAARDFLRDGDEDAFNESMLGSSLISSLLLSAATLALAIVSVIWLFRVASNHRSLGRRLTWAPGWAIGGWFLPPFLFIIPFLMLRESFKASTPTVAPGDESWRQAEESPQPWVWLIAYGIAPVIVGLIGSFQLFGGIGGEPEDVADRILDTGVGITVLQSVVGIIGVVAWGWLVRSLTARHVQLTGESGAR